MKNGNGLYLEMKAIAGTMLHRKSEPRIHKVVPKLAVSRKRGGGAVISSSCLSMR